jgi:ubiquinone/menaquinone biosynthesis C-methylase UbiE
MSVGAKIVEFGCGNGRDAWWIAKQKMEYLGLDLSMAAVEQCRQRFGSDCMKHCEFLAEDFSAPELLLDESGGYDLVYSRFTMHSVTDDQEAVAISNTFRLLKPGGRFMVEARSTRDPRCGVGVRVSPNAYVETHYRRFLELHTTVTRFEEAGFDVRSACEEVRAAMFLSDKASVVRVIAVKPPQAPRVSNSANTASTGECIVGNDGSKLFDEGIENTSLQ